jgi:hypothetical protein
MPVKVMKRVAIKDPYFPLKWEIAQLPEEQQTKWELMHEMSGDLLLFERIQVLYPRKIKDLVKVIDIIYAKMEKE